MRDAPEGTGDKIEANKENNPILTLQIFFIRGLCRAEMHRFGVNDTSVLVLNATSRSPRPDVISFTYPNMTIGDRFRYGITISTDSNETVRDNSQLEYRTKGIELVETVSGAPVALSTALPFSATRHTILSVFTYYLYILRRF